MNDKVINIHEHHRKVEEIFNRVVDRSDDDTRRMLDELCGNNTTLRSDVQRLLSVGDESLGEFMCASESAITENSYIAGYKIIKQIGEGGMGSVFLAEQENPRRQVALKSLKSGFASTEVRKRFEYEAQVLGQLQHPGIAQIYEAGSTNLRNPAGLEFKQPYFAMELVEGCTLTEYASSQGLSIADRLRLVVDVCLAVQSAHQHGVVHRDLKPGNILVTEQGQVKILDFGVARLLDNNELAHSAGLTQTGQLLGTLAYMSPEQVSGNSAQIDTRSDVYSIGVILYELLADQLPYDLNDRTIVKAVNVIANDDPLPLTTVNRKYRGDVNTIVLKALEKDPQRRYQSASDLAADLQRFLNDEVVVARPATTVYQLQKFTQRNKGLVAGVSAAFVLLIVGVVVASVFAVGQSRALAESEIQRQVTLALNEFLIDDLLKLADPRTQSNREITLRESLDQAVERLEGRFADAPVIEANIRKTVGQAYRHLGEFDAAQQHLTKAYDLYRSVHGEADKDALLCRMELGAILINRSEFDRAFAVFEPLLVEQRLVFGDDHEQTMASLHNLGVILSGQGRLDESEKYFDEALEKRLRVLGEDDTQTATTMNNLSVIYQYTERFEEAAQILSRAIAIHRRVSGEEHPDTILAMANLGAAHYRLKNYEEAADIFEEALVLRRRTVGEEHPDTLQVASSLAVAYGKLGKSEEREKILRTTLSIQERVLGARHFNTLSTRMNIAAIPYDRGEFEQAEREYAEVTKAFSETYPDHFLGGLSALRHGRCFLKLGRLEDAAGPLLAAHRMFNSQFGPDDSRTRQAVETLIELYDRSGDPEQLAHWRSISLTESDNSDMNR